MSERKHLFNSTEKSDFIVNMTEGQYQKMGLIYLGMASVVMFIMSIPYYLAKGGLSIFNNGLVKYVDTSVANATCGSYISYLQIALFAMGFFGFLILLVSATKEYFKAKENKAFLLILMLMLLITVAMFKAYSIKYSFFGKDYRYHGLLTYFSYIGLFVAASQVNSRERRKTFLDLFVSIAFINAVYGILQVIPQLVETVPNFFYEMAEFSQEPSLSFERFAADGLVHTPHALAALMTMALAVGGAGFIYEEKSKLRRNLYGIASVVFIVAGISTATLAGTVGIASVLLVLLVTEIVRIAKKQSPKRSKLFEKAIVRCLILIIVCGAVFGAMSAIDRTSYYDDYIIYNDATARIGASNPTDDPNGVATSYGLEIYPKLWKEGLKLLKPMWVFGYGPDCIGMVYYGSTELYNVELGFTADRSFNEYLDFALACGVPALLVFLALLLLTFKKGARMIGSFFKKEDSWTSVAVLAAVIGYCVQANMNISIITVTPLFFILAGILWNKPHTPETTVKRKQIKK